MAVFNSLQFDDINSLDYGIYITGEAVYNSPERDVEVVSVPGRNGDILIDNGRYNNIEVTYRAGCFGANQDEFAQKIKAFRAVLASKKGYQRITDTYNPNEYRMGTFIKSIEVSKESYDRVGEFDIIFDCKPQRFLTSGETEISVARNANINNPTLFDAKPMVMVHGYGKLAIGSYEINLDGGLIGTVTVVDGTRRSDYLSGTSYTWSVDYSNYADSVNAGDPLNVSLMEVRADANVKSTSLRVTSVNGSSTSVKGITTHAMPMNTEFTAFPSANETETATTTTSVVLSNDVAYTQTITLTAVNKPSGVIEITGTVSNSPDVSTYMSTSLTFISISGVTIDSSVSSVGDPTYIDCDIGEAYLIDASDNIVSLNALIELGSDLPVLAPGNTEIAYDNTITAVEVVPRWWIL